MLLSPLAYQACEYMRYEMSLSSQCHEHFKGHEAPKLYRKSQMQEISFALKFGKTWRI